MAIDIIDLGVHTVRFGVKGDPDRIKKMVGDFNHHLDEELNPFGFEPRQHALTGEHRGIKSWPEGERIQRLFAIKLGMFFPCLEAALLEILLMGNSFPRQYQFAGFPHLTALSTQEMIRKMQSRGIRWLVCTDINSLWEKPCFSHHRYIPSLDTCCPGEGSALITFDTTDNWEGHEWFLFCQG